MITINDIKQSSEDWFRLKAGVISASRAAEFASEPKLAPMPDDFSYHYMKDNDGHHYYMSDGSKFQGKNKSEVELEIRSTLPPVYGDMRQGYMAELVGQIATGLPPEEMNFKQCEWGKEYEDAARAFFEIEMGLDVEVPAFIYKDEDKRCGISPDGLIVGEYKGKKVGLELKCPFTTKVFIEFVTCDKIKNEYIEQCQFSMWVTGYDAWFFANYDPRVKTKNLHYILIDRDQSYMDKYDRAYIEFKKDMDLMLSKLNLQFGEQW